MNKIAEGKMNGTNFSFNGWFRSFVGLLISTIIGLSSYTFVKVSNAVERVDTESRKRDEKLSDEVAVQRVLIAELTAMRTDVTEIKRFLQRNTWKNVDTP